MISKLHRGTFVNTLNPCNLVVSAMLKRKLNKGSNSGGEKQLKTNPHIINDAQNRSKYFEGREGENLALEEEMLEIQSRLCRDLQKISFKAPVKYVYNPLIYASKCNEAYVKKYCRNLKKVLFVGMNPGPFGMCQTGVPFGEIKSVRDWMGIKEIVEKPPVECPERPVNGFECSRTEVSGDRLWNLFKKLSSSPETFFENSFVYNYCPLAFMKIGGANVTPSELKDAGALEEICDKYFAEVINLLHPEVIVGIGRYAEKRCNIVLKIFKINGKVLCMPHPSPRAINNQNWPEKAENFLIENDLIQYIQ